MPKKEKQKNKIFIAKQLNNITCILITPAIYLLTHRYNPTKNERISNQVFIRIIEGTRYG